MPTINDLAAHAGPCFATAQDNEVRLLMKFDPAMSHLDALRRAAEILTRIGITDCICNQPRKERS